MNRRILLTATALAAALAVAGCGKKPKAVDPPQGRENDRFPRTYPAPSSTETPAKAPQSQSGGGSQGVSPGGAPNLGPPNAGTSPDDPPSPVPTVGGFRFP